MAVFAVTNTFVSGAVILASGHNTNWSDVTTWLNNRYNGSDTWLFMKVSSTSANPVDITSSASGSTELSINNTATDGDPELTFKLSGSQTHIIGVDDSDSDFLKFATTGITTNVAMQIPTVGSQVQFNAGTVSLPGISIIGDPDTGIWHSGANVLSVTANATLVTEWIPTGMTIQSTQKFWFDGGNDTYIYEASANLVNLTVGGSLSCTFVAGDVYTVAFTDYSATTTVTGWASFTTKLVYYKVIGKLVWVWYNLSGTSNATSASFTLPLAASNTVTIQLNGYTTDNGTDTTGGGLISLTKNTATVNLYKDMASANWTNSGTKQAYGQLFYQTT